LLLLAAEALLPPREARLEVAVPWPGPAMEFRVVTAPLVRFAVEEEALRVLLSDELRRWPSIKALRAFCRSNLLQLKKSISVIWEIEIC